MLQVLTINHPKHGSMNWYFECSVDDVDKPDTDFNQAVALAKDLGIFVASDREEIITEFFEFENALREDKLLPQEEDELTKALNEYISAMADVKIHNAEVAVWNERFHKANTRHQDAVKALAPLLKGKARVMGDTTYIAEYDTYNRPLIKELKLA